MEELLAYYNQELNRVHHLTLEFARKYPKIAKHLAVNSGHVEDPDVARIIESFAFLSANIHYKINDDFPEIAESMLRVLYPHYLCTIPSFSIVQFKQIHELQGAHFIEKSSLLETTSLYEKTCSFTTLYPVALWPIEVWDCRLNSKPFKAPYPEPNTSQFKLNEKIEAILQLTLKCTSPKQTFSSLAPECLRFYLDGPPQQVYKILDLILNDILIIGIAKGNAPPVFIDRSNVQGVGFHAGENLLPFSAFSSQGYDLITEYFIFPEKFLFFDLKGLTEANLAQSGSEIDVFFYLKQSCKELERTLVPGFFKLGCTPIVNLYQQLADPIRLTHTQTEYLVIPNARMLSTESEVHTIKKVSIYNEKGDELQCFPFYGIRHHQLEKDCYWHVTQRADRGNFIDTYLSFSNLDFNPAFNEDDAIAEVEILGTEGSLPFYLPFGGGEPHLQLKSKDDLVASINCLSAFTSPIKPRLRNKIRWKLIAHLSLNFFSLIEEGRAVDMLKEILTLYDFKGSLETKQIIESIQKISCKQVTARWASGFRQSFCQGVEIQVTLHASYFAANDLFLFVKILDHFFARFVTLNSFTELIVFAHQDLIYHGPRRAGTNICF